MKQFILFLIFILTPLISIGQSNESIYAINYGITSKQVTQDKEIYFGEVKQYPNSSYIKIKSKENNSFYIQTIVNGKFAYGHYFKFLKKINGEYKYVRIDGEEIEYVLTNFTLDELAFSNINDEKVIFKLINYRTSFAILLKF